MCGYFCPRGGRSFDDCSPLPHLQCEVRINDGIGGGGTARRGGVCPDITRGGPSGAEAAIQARPILLPMQK